MGGGAVRPNTSPYPPLASDSRDSSTCHIALLANLTSGAPPWACAPHRPAALGLGRLRYETAKLSGSSRANDGEQCVSTIPQLEVALRVTMHAASTGSQG